MRSFQRRFSFLCVYFNPIIAVVQVTEAGQKRPPEFLVAHLYIPEVTFLCAYGIQRRKFISRDSVNMSTQPCRGLVTRATQRRSGPRQST